MPRNKKGMEAIWIIVMLVLALIVLVVLTAILTGQAGKFGIGLKAATKTCDDPAIGGHPEIASEGCKGTDQQVLGAEVPVGYICCAPPKSK